MSLIRFLFIALFFAARAWATDCSAVLATGDHYQYDAVVFGAPAVVYWTTYSGGHPAGCNTRIVLDINTNTAAYTCDACTACPSNMQLSGGTCVVPTCPAGQVYNNGACGIDCAAMQGQAASTGYYDMGTDPTAAPQVTGCSMSGASGCMSSFTGTAPAARALVNGVYHYYAKGSYTYLNGGMNCTATDKPALSATSAPPSPTCGANQTSGTVNGQTVCVDMTSGNVTDNTKTTPQPSSTTQYTTNPDGTSTRTTTTTNPDGTTNTYTVNYNGSGQPVSTTGQDPNQPQDPCLANPGRTGCADLGDPNKITPDKLATSTVNLSFSEFGIASNETCPAPIPLNIGGHSMNVDYTPICTYASGIRFVVVGVAYLTAALIVIGTFRDA